MSGFLITLLLLREREASGGISLRSFYRRRALRIFPAYYTFWAVCVLFGYRSDAGWSFFYLENYRCAFHGPEALLSISWSLAIEEQFYLAWPLLLRSINLKTVMKALVVLIPCVQLYRLLLVSGGFWSYAHFAFDTRMDALLAGCLLACLVLQRYQFPEWMFGVRAAALAGLILLAACALKYRAQMLVGFAVVTYAGALVMMRAIAYPPRFLNHPVARHLGKISYSLYLYHTIAAVLAARWWSGTPLNGIAGWTAGSLILAEASYWGVERWFLRLKNAAPERHVKG